MSCQPCFLRPVQSSHLVMSASLWPITGHAEPYRCLMMSAGRHAAGGGPGAHLRRHGALPHPDHQERHQQPGTLPWAAHMPTQASWPVAGFVACDDNKAGMMLSLIPSSSVHLCVCQRRHSCTPDPSPSVHHRLVDSGQRGDATSMGAGRRPLVHPAELQLRAGLRTVRQVPRRHLPQGAVLPDRRHPARCQGTVVMVTHSCRVTTCRAGEQSTGLAAAPYSACAVLRAAHELDQQ